MKDSLTSRNHADFKQRYQNTIGWLLRNNAKQLVRIIDVSANRVTFSNGSDLEFSVNVDSGIYFEFIPVNRGWFNASNGQTYLLQRFPARMWKRGISNENTSCTAADSIGVPMRVTFEVADAIFNNPEGPYGIRKGKSFALSKHFAVTKKNEFYFYNQKVGKLDNNRITLDNSLFEQEVRDMLRRNNYPIEGVVING